MMGLSRSDPIFLALVLAMGAAGCIGLVLLASGLVSLIGWLRRKR
jgi:hypothetical protein